MKNTINTENTYKNKTIKHKKSQGGKVLASGGFGCVFTPALKCERESKRAIGKVTKLMSEKHAIEEYEEINSIKTKLDSIKNYTSYYLIYDVTLCKPAKLTPSDLKEYTNKCTALPKDKITKKNINTNLEKIMALNIPNGGLPVDDFLYKNGSYAKIYQLQNKLVDLLKNGIIPMNEKNIYHCDIKDSNILVDESSSDLKTRLIDWGLSTEYKPFINQPFPKSWRNRPFQFNVPFSVIIFSDFFIEKYKIFINNGGNYKDEDEIRPFVVDYIIFWMEERGAGHYKFINEIMYNLFSNSLSIPENNKPKVIETEFTMNYIVNYIVNILKKYTKFRSDGSINLREYLDNVFIKNIDIWGFISVYYPILELLYNNYSKLNNFEKELFELLKNLFVNYLYLTSDEAIDKVSLLSELKKIEQIIYKNISKNKNKNIIHSNSTNSIKTRKIYNSKSNISFKRRLKKHRFKKPFFLKLNK
jgi:serine/threonine protein kinase